MYNPHFDMNFALDRVYGDKSFLAHLLRIFCEDYAGAPMQIGQALQAGDFDALEHGLHRIKGCANTLGLPELSRCTLLAEQAIGIREDYAIHVQGVIDSFHPTVSVLEAAIMELEKGALDN